MDWDVDAFLEVPGDDPFNNQCQRLMQREFWYTTDLTHFCRVPSVDFFVAFDQTSYAIEDLSRPRNLEKSGSSDCPLEICLFPECRHRYLGGESNMEQNTRSCSCVENRRRKTDREFYVVQALRSVTLPLFSDVMRHSRK